MKQVVNYSGSENIKETRIKNLENKCATMTIELEIAKRKIKKLEDENYQLKNNQIIVTDKKDKSAILGFKSKQWINEAIMTLKERNEYITKRSLLKEISPSINKDKDHDTELFLKINKFFKEAEEEIAIEDLFY
ncbi:MAG: hypothetical protein KO202_07515 [Methanobacteriaceae archaeon]|jgi:gas vesicle protein|nr:hypothetical protein [Methanobacteriaceae archaeon]